MPKAAKTNEREREGESPSFKLTLARQPQQKTSAKRPRQHAVDRAFHESERLRMTVKLKTGKAAKKLETSDVVTMSKTGEAATTYMPTSRIQSSSVKETRKKLLRILKR